jgi:hypothetical protein
MIKAAANDIYRILNAFDILNMPKDFRGMMSPVKSSNPTLLHGNHSFICPSCFSKGSNALKCIVTRCQSAPSYVRTLTWALNFPLVPPRSNKHGRK